MYFHNARKKKHKRSKRNSGGIIIFYRKELQKHTSVNDKIIDNMLWIKIDKHFLNFDKDLFIGAIYNSPIQSSYTQKQNSDFFMSLQNKMTSFSPDDNIIIGGDFNARTGILPDYIHENEKDINFLNLPDDYKIDKITTLRNNQDIRVNEYGQKLIDFAISTKCKILNGRCLGDYIGKYTYLGYNGVSTVDYILASESFILQNHIHAFNVGDITHLSDHRPLTLRLKYEKLVKKTQRNETVFPKPKLIKIKDNNRYKNYLNTEMNIETVTQIINDLNKSNVTTVTNNITQNIAELYITAANKCNPTKDPTQRPKNKNNKTWYTKDCKLLKRELNRISKSLNKNPSNNNKCILYYTTLKRYKNLLKHKRREHEENALGKLENLFEENRDEFWKLLKSMENHNKNEELPEIDKLNNHFKTLYSKEENKYVVPPLKYTNTDTNKIKFKTLNDTFTESEIKLALKNLKNKKSPGYDRISNEMLKCTNSHGIILLTTLFNKILKSGSFPPAWNYGLIKAIHKGNDVFDPDNYRGITLNSCLGKLFCNILYNRLAPLLEKEDVFCKEQSGFRKEHRTTDHIFLLHKIIKQYTEKNKTLFTCFVDFSKAFDSIWRSALMKKLDAIGLSDNFLQIIRSMYTNTTNSLIYKDNITDTFESNIGVKQGDVLSTILFNLYINDLPDVLSFQGSDAVTIHNTQINCLKYADDLVIMSSSKEGLQKCLEKLETYCTTWKLELNIKKTKVILFNKSGTLFTKYSFFYKLNKIEIVRQYKYLGFIFSCSGSPTNGIQTLINQAQKAWYTIQYYLSSSKEKPIKTYLTLFDAKIKPILLYACEAWAETIKNDFDSTSFLTRNKVEHFHIKILKQLLRVSKKTPNIAVLLELGRFPITLNMHFQTIKYFSRLFSINQNRLLYQLFKAEIQKFLQGNTGFVAFIVNTLNKIGMSDIWRIQINRNDNYLEQPKITKKVLKRLQDIYLQTSFEQLRNNAKLTFLSSLKDTYTIENYLKLNNTNNRKALTQIRTSSHTLAIETGRWEKLKREERLCKHCNRNLIEDEQHLIFDCSNYSTERSMTFQFIKTQTNIDLQNNTHRTNNLKNLFNSDAMSSLNAFGKFINYSLRKSKN